MPLPLTIKCNGFELRVFQLSDAEPLAEIEFDPEVKQFLAIPAKRKDDWIEGIRNLGISGWVIQTDGQVAGSASIKLANLRGDRELRIVIGRAFWGRALGTRVAAVVIKVAFEQLSAKAVIGVVHPENKASLRLLRLFKFRRRGVVQDHKPPWQYGHFIYRLTRKAYSLSTELKANGVHKA